MRLPFIVGIKRIDRIRGSGWLDCPNCHEHAVQDVVDRMAFFALLFFRFTPVSRSRELVCRRCNFRRPAGDELGHLDTAGERIRSAWFVPFGALTVLAGVGVAVFLQNAGLAEIDTRLTFVEVTAKVGATQPVMQFDRPSVWTLGEGTDSAGVPFVKYADGQAGAQLFLIRRVETATTLDDLIAQRYADDSSATTRCFPTSPPKGESTKLAGQDAKVITLNYVPGGGGKARTLMWVLIHQHVGYTVSYIGKGDTGIATLSELAARVNKSIKFLNDEPSPRPTATPDATDVPSPGSTAEPTPTDTPSPSPSDTATAGASGSPSPEVGCS